MGVQVAVIIVSYNTRELLLECLASVFDSVQDRSIELVIVDNASEDGSPEAVRQAYAHIRLIQNSKNLGFGAACNQGIRVTSSNFILLLNSDARLTAQAFKALCDCLEQNECCAVAGCALIDAAGAEMINTRNFLTPLNQAFELTGIKAGLRFLERTRRPNLDRNLRDCTVDWIDAACLMLRRAALDDTGSFDERFFMYSEEEDLCFRLRQRGWVVCFCGAGTAVHHGGGSSILHKIEMLRHFYMSQMAFLTKHRSRRSTLFYAVFMKTVLVLKCWLGRDSDRRKAAKEQLTALNEARATRHHQT